MYPARVWDKKGAGGALVGRGIRPKRLCPTSAEVPRSVDPLFLHSSSPPLTSHILNTRKHSVVVGGAGAALQAKTAAAAAHNGAQIAFRGLFAALLLSLSLPARQTASPPVLLLLLRQRQQITRRRQLLCLAANVCLHTLNSLCGGVRGATSDTTDSDSEVAPASKQNARSLERARQRSRKQSPPASPPSTYDDQRLTTPLIEVIKGHASALSSHFLQTI